MSTRAAPSLAEFARLYTGHRAATDRRLALLGPGPCLDLDLRSLLASFAELTLVDIDAATLHRAVASQCPERSPGLALRGDVDVTEPIRRCRRTPPSGSTGSGDTRARRRLRRRTASSR